MPTAFPMSRMVGGYRFSRRNWLMNPRMASWRRDKAIAAPFRRTGPKLPQLYTNFCSMSRPINGAEQWGGGQCCGCGMGELPIGRQHVPLECSEGCEAQ